MIAVVSIPWLMSLWKSNAKVENVVKPPRNPVTASGEIQVGWWVFSSP